MIVDLHDDAENDFFYGWQVLALETLAARLSNREQHESRAVFANWGWDQMPMLPTTVLRAAYWSNSRTSEAVSEQVSVDDPVPVLIPARFVWLPTNQVQEWIAGFERLHVPVGDLSDDDDETPIRRLKVDLGWITKMMEKRWQSRDTDHVALNQYWEQVWKEMTAILNSAPMIDDLSSIDEGESWLQEWELHSFRYDSNQYDPERFVV